ncbi:MAG: transglycosylase domain-containing protein [Candidatus Tectomicrobia bacterium]|nr:transglycosylase domain-containing protein [Candidatus Tectomicrobia bacterium]
MLDRHGIPLSITFQNPWNIHHTASLHDLPLRLRQAFILAEDQRFYRHRGVDWRARAHALVQNLRARHIVRGASTITEQAVRMLHPRPRTLWSRWLETFEAMQLERQFTKADILEFYLNQVPYARQLRGIVQAAHAYFDRDPDTLSLKEMLGLAVLVRSPSRLDLTRDPTRIEPAVTHLAQRLRHAGFISAADVQRVLEGTLELSTSHLPVQASPFIRYVMQQTPPSTYSDGTLHTTLDATLQQHAHAILRRQLHNLRNRHVTDGALLAVDHHTNEVLAWVNAGESQIDAVITPRQPGSTLKPFLYALALERGWTASTLIDDSPLAQAVGVGLHRYHNYSRSHHGPLRLREALGNSLNIPAVRTIGFVGPQRFLTHLHQLGFQSLSQSAAYYGDGLALGNGEVTLLELVRAYASLARHGVSRPLRVSRHAQLPASPKRRVYAPETGSLIAHILADPHARQREFGRGNLLRFPVETAVKTGTSTDYRDAWAIGFSHRYTVGVWMGNLTRRPMLGVTGSIGPALVLRAVFAELNRHTDSQPLHLHPNLRSGVICRMSGQHATPNCPSMREWFRPGTQPPHTCPLHQPAPPAESKPFNLPLQLLQPTPALQIAMDPRLPDSREAFSFRLPNKVMPLKTRWLVDGQQVGQTATAQRHFLWTLAPGAHTAQAQVWVTGRSQPIRTPIVQFIVK